jgi:RNA polymerase sigma-70 factor, ECF subfamily
MLVKILSRCQNSYLNLAELALNSEDQRDIDKVLGGDIDVFANIVVRHQPYLTSIISGMVPRSDVEDMTQKAFVSAFQRLSSYNGSVPLKHWLCRIAVNKCNDFWREQKRYKNRIDKVLESKQEDLISKHHQGLELDEILENLHPKDRLLMKCLYIEDMSIETTALHLGWSIANVKIRAFRAKKKLRAVLSRKMSFVVSVNG